MYREVAASQAQKKTFEVGARLPLRLQKCPPCETAVPIIGSIVRRDLKISKAFLPQPERAQTRPPSSSPRKAPVSDRLPSEQCSPHGCRSFHSSALDERGFRSYPSPGSPA